MGCTQIGIVTASTVRKPEAYGPRGIARYLCASRRLTIPVSTARFETIAIYRLDQGLRLAALRRKPSSLARFIGEPLKRVENSVCVIDFIPSGV